MHIKSTTYHKYYFFLPYLTIILQCEAFYLFFFLPSLNCFDLFLSLSYCEQSIHSSWLSHMYDIFSALSNSQQQQQQQASLKMFTIHSRTMKILFVYMSYSCLSFHSIDVPYGEEATTVAVAAATKNIRTHTRILSHDCSALAHTHNTIDTLQFHRFLCTFMSLCQFYQTHNFVFVKRKETQRQIVTARAKKIQAAVIV